MGKVVNFILGLVAFVVAMGTIFGFSGVLMFSGLLSYIVILLGVLLLIFGGRKRFNVGGHDFGGWGSHNQFTARSPFINLVRWIFGPYLIFSGLASLIESLESMFPYISVNSISGLIIIAAIGAIEMFVSFK